MPRIVTPATLSIGIYEFHPEALAAPLLLLLIEARLAERHGRFWLWFVAVLSVKENMALLLVAFCAVWAVLDWKRGRAWLLRVGPRAARRRGRLAADLRKGHQPGAERGQR